MLYSNLADLVAIPSVTRSKEEIEIVWYIEDLLKSIISWTKNTSWIEVTIEKVEEKGRNWIFHGGVICNIKVSDDLDTVGLLWHLDVVPVVEKNWIKSPFKMIEEEDRVYGRWVCDMKAWVVIMVEILKNALEKKPNKNISLLFTSWEECWTPDWLTEILKSKKVWWLDFVIALEPTWWKINTWVFWYLDWEFIFKWKSCHSSRPSIWENAIHKVWWLLNYLQNPDIIWLVEYYWKQLEETLSATMINWWIACNIIPDSCNVQINHRYSPKSNWANVENNFNNLASELWAESFNVIEHNPSSQVVETINPILVDFIKKIRWNTSMLNVVPFWSDISQTSWKWIPSINFWPWNIEQAHTDDEFLLKKDFEEIHKQFLNYLFD